MSARRSTVDPIAVRSLALLTVAHLGVRRRQLDEETGATLRAVYAAGGITWSQIGAALGTTASVAWHLAHPRADREEASSA